MTIARNLLSEILKGQLQEDAAHEVADVDEWIDQSLDQLEHEEPQLATYLASPEVINAVRATMTAIYWIFIQDSQKGKPILELTKRFEVLILRLAATLSHKALVMGRSEDIPVSFKD